VKRAWPLAAIAAAAVAAPIATSSSEPANGPSAALAVAPNPIVAGEQATLDASGSSDDGAIVSYAWDLDGDGSFERVAGSAASLTEAFAEAGSARVGVRVVDDEGLSSDAFETVTVEPKPEPEPKRIAAAPEPEPAASEERSSTKSVRPAAEDREEPEAKPKATRKPEAKLSAAAATTVSIADFSFSPKSVTISPSDTVTWRNNGDEVHTATGDGFDTGNISSGGSASHTFQSAGTFSYLCKPHPFMKATVRVVGSGGSDGGSDGGGSADATQDDGGRAGTSGSGDDLPSTGLALAGLVIPGLLMLSAGVALRRRLDT
jgi:plastocyanin